MQYPGMLKTPKLRTALMLIFALAYPLDVKAAPSVTKGFELIVPIGDGEFEIAGLGGGSEDWKPLFFAADVDGVVSIPDHYRSRILRFSKKGASLPSVACIAITPRMNYFGVSPAGGWVVFSDSVLYRIGLNGSIIWSAPFPLMVFPERIYPSREFVSVRVAGAVDGQANSIIISDSPPHTATLEAIGTESGKVPAIRTDSDLKPFTLRDARQVFPGAWTSGDPDASLMATGPGAMTWWGKRNNEIIELIRYTDANGRGEPVSIQIPTDGEGFWFTVVPQDSGSALVYANRSLSDAIAISGFLIRY